jgi:hypothetical protein
MAPQKILGGLLLVAGIVAFGLGTTSGPDQLVILGVVLAATGAIFIVVNALISPIMKSSREMAESSGMEVSRLTGAPKLGASLAQGRERMADAQQMMAGLTGNAAMRANGQAGTAMVTSARATGQQSNMNPVYEVGLTVTPDGGTPYDVTVVSEVNTLGVAKAVAGTRVPVTVDATDPTNVLIDWISVI